MLATARAAIHRIAAKAACALRSAVSPEKLLRVLTWVYYIPLWLWGIYGTFFAAPATYVLPVMGQAIYNVWVWLHIIATSVVMAGLRLEDKTSHDKWELIGLIYQSWGHFCMFLVLLAYEMSAIDAIVWGTGAYSIFVLAPYVLGAFLLAIQGVAKIVVGDDKPRGGES